jgi:alginate O-acetyltransferase complex protein AlgI
LIFYYKYFSFVSGNINLLFDNSSVVDAVILPLGIFFFTFQQISYLVDASEGKIRDKNFLHYGLFVSFFPQLIAGPIVHHSEILPQFVKGGMLGKLSGNIVVGTMIFSIGLAKKVIIADNVAEFANPVFQAAELGVSLTFFEAWFGTFAYTFQLYYDFSGYSDMAVGLAWMFGIHLPLNFNSPYKAASIIDFWRRWHMTLSRFLKDYLYIPLGGNRKGRWWRAVNIMITMLLGGLWHGAGWTFVAWGALHGALILLNHIWRMPWRVPGSAGRRRSRLALVLSRIITFLAVAVAWVFFRADSFEGASAVLSAMFGGNGISLPSALLAYAAGWENFLSGINLRFDGMFYNDFLNGHLGWQHGVPFIILLIFHSHFLPNTQELVMGDASKEYSEMLSSGKSIRVENMGHRFLLLSILSGVLVALSLAGMLEVSEFLYFQF